MAILCKDCSRRPDEVVLLVDCFVERGCVEHSMAPVKISVLYRWQNRWGKNEEERKREGGGEEGERAGERKSLIS